MYNKKKIQLHNMYKQMTMQIVQLEEKYLNENI